MLSGPHQAVLVGVTRSLAAKSGPQLFLELGRSVCLCRRPRSLVRNDDLTVARVDHEDGEKLGRFRVAGIVAHLVMITRLLRPALASLIGAFGLVVDFAADRPFQHPRINEGRGRMTM